MDESTIYQRIIDTMEMDDLLDLLGVDIEQLILKFKPEILLHKEELEDEWLDRAGELTFNEKGDY
jgi:hypothetical protein|tara:strand:- start:220 stop:414 length:195 start_codon:yes stop_codon:yes gene_type:complete